MLFTDEGDNHRGRSQDIFCPPWGGGRKSPDHPHVPAVPEAFLGLLTEKFSRATGGRGGRGRTGAPKKPKSEKVNLSRCLRMLRGHGKWEWWQQWMLSFSGPC